VNAPRRPPKPPVPVVFEDNHILAVFKPPGWIVQGARPEDPSLLETLREWIRVRDGKPGAAYLGVIHRLDRPVSGIVVLAKRSKAASRLSAEIRERRFAKTYRAIVEGIPAKPQGTLVGQLWWDDASRRARCVEGTTDGQRAELRYRTLETRGGRALLEIELVTGRKHQIRAQLAGVGHPLVGDALYGSRTSLSSVALCAWSVEFSHPVERDRRVVIEVPSEQDPFPAWWTELAR
jgi:23S rRNA pseudouridine1911/1915/1917 synthase